jgi:hypothetical protein
MLIDFVGPWQELHELFIDLAFLVEAQGEMIDQIEFNVTQVSVCMLTRLIDWCSCCAPRHSLPLPNLTGSLLASGCGFCARSDCKSAYGRRLPEKGSQGW